MPTNHLADPKRWIDRLELLPHPEGGYFRETYRSDLEIQLGALAGGIEPNSRLTGVRSVSTAIYYLLSGIDFSSLHRIRSDEVWHFYDGEPLRVSAILPDGSATDWLLGVGIDEGGVPQCVVPAGAWFGAELVDKSAYALVGCTVAPGFDFVDFELADRASLLAQHPEHADLITRLTRKID